VPDAPTYEQLQQLVGQLTAQVVELERIVAEQADEIAELRRRSASDSSNWVRLFWSECEVGATWGFRRVVIV
jgi:hypothetical protein